MKILALTNSRGLEARISDLGGRILSLLVPDRHGRSTNVVVCRDSPYAGAIVGRYANRIAGARFALDDKVYELAANDWHHHLHGGWKGFDKVMWQAEASPGTVTLRYTSPDGEEGYPGTLVARVTYTLHENNELVVEYHATTDHPTVVNLTQHSYFNLAGEGKVLDHLLQINADAITPVDQTMIPTGEITPVEGTPFDFRTLRPIGKAYDQNFVLNRTEPGLVRATLLVEPATGRTLSVHTTEPGLQLYTGNPNGVCLETQHFPDSPNHPEFPSTVLQPGEEFHSRTVFAFGLVA